jgi:hypothetical protein
MSHTMIALRAQHALVTSRLASLDTAAAVPGDSTGGDDEIMLRPGWKKSAQELWEAKLIQIHTAAVIEGNELYPVDPDGRCTECRLDVRALQRMQPNTSVHPLS